MLPACLPACCAVLCGVVGCPIGPLVPVGECRQQLAVQPLVQLGALIMGWLTQAQELYRSRKTEPEHVYVRYLSYLAGFQL